ncbi:hypothetical protein PQ610_02040 [Tardisphaera miroshnichenkoae]
MKLNLFIERWACCGDIKVHPTTRHPGVSPLRRLPQNRERRPRGHVFGYLLRAELKRLNRSSAEENLIADTAIGPISREIERAGVFRCRNRTLGGNELDAMKDTVKKFHEERASSVKRALSRMAS